MWALTKLAIRRSFKEPHAKTFNADSSWEKELRHDKRWVHNLSRNAPQVHKTEQTKLSTKTTSCSNQKENTSRKPENIMSILEHLNYFYFVSLVA